VGAFQVLKVASFAIFGTLFGLCVQRSFCHKSLVIITSQPAVFPATRSIRNKTKTATKKEGIRRSRGKAGKRKWCKEENKEKTLLPLMAEVRFVSSDFGA